VLSLKIVAQQRCAKNIGRSRRTKRTELLAESGSVRAGFIAALILTVTDSTVSRTGALVLGFRERRGNQQAGRPGLKQYRIEWKIAQ